jgi:hypothetical protein
MGASGRRYVEENYAWDAVLDKFEAVVPLAQERFAARRYVLGVRD